MPYSGQIDVVSCCDDSRCTWSETSRTYLTRSVHTPEACALTVHNRPHHTPCRMHHPYVGSCEAADAPEVPPGHRLFSLRRLTSWMSPAGPGGVPGRADRRQGCLRG